MNGYLRRLVPMRRLLLFIAMLMASGLAPSTQAQPSPSLDALFSAYVDADGFVDYEALHADYDDALAPHVEALAGARPDTLGVDERRAFWLNAYNVLTLALIARHYPVNSVWEIQQEGSEALGPFERPVGVVAGDTLSLDAIQYTRIRPLFRDDPRYHMALVCAAVSCPPLRQEAYTGSELHAQLEAQARRFVQNPMQNVLLRPQEIARLSSIFEWYRDEFGGSDAKIQQFIAAYIGDEAAAERLRAEAYVVTYRSYDWTLNAQRLN